MSRTSAYTELHTAFASAAEPFQVQPVVARVALAVWERGGSTTSQELAADLRFGEGSQVRRALQTMYQRGLAIGTGPGGGRRRPGLVTQVRLSDRGRALVELVLQALPEEMAA